MCYKELIEGKKKRQESSGPVSFYIGRDSNGKREKKCVFLSELWT